MTQFVTGSFTSNLLIPQVKPGIISQVFKPQRFLNFLESVGAVENTLASPVRVHLETTANSTTALAYESDTVSTVGSATISEATVNSFYVSSVFGFSGQTLDNVAKNAYYVDPVEWASTVAEVANIRSKMDQTLLGSRQDIGISSICSNGVYGGIDGGSVTTWATTQTSVGGALTLAAFEDAVEAILGVCNEEPTHILVPNNQMTNYTAINRAGASNSAFRIMAPAQNNGVFDVGAGATLSGRISYNGMPLIAVPGLTTTEIILFNKDHYRLMVTSDIQVTELARLSYDKRMLMTMGAAPVVDLRAAFHRLTGVTA
jgi:hypothetical protein